MNQVFLCCCLSLQLACPVQRRESIDVDGINEKSIHEPMKAFIWPSKNEQWMENNMAKAMKLALSGVMSQTRAAEACS